MAIFKETRFAFRLEGTHVVMQIDDVDIAMDYALAFKISASLNQIARRAKQLAADVSTHLNIIATLSDANQDELAAQVARDATVFNPGAMTTRKPN